MSDRPGGHRAGGVRLGGVGLGTRLQSVVGNSQRSVRFQAVPCNSIYQGGSNRCSCGCSRSKWSFRRRGRGAGSRGACDSMLPNRGAEGVRRNLHHRHGRHQLHPDRKHAANRHLLRSRHLHVKLPRNCLFVCCIALLLQKPSNLDSLLVIGVTERYNLLLHYI